MRSSYLTRGGFRRWAAAACVAALAWVAPAAATELGVDGARFTLDGKPAFLLGCSYYAGAGAGGETLGADLDALKRQGFNWVRVWATWAAFEHDVSAVDEVGNARPPYVERLRRLVDECDPRGMVVDVTLSRGNGGTGPARLQGLEPHRRAVATLAATLAGKKNWYLDLSNERNISDKRFTSVADLGDLRAVARRADPGLLVTASHAGDLTREDVVEYLRVARLDFLSVHRPRDRNSPAATAAATREIRKWVAGTLGPDRTVPVQYDEPFRRGWSDWEPTADDFRADLDAARAGGAAGWCFHNGAQKNAPDNHPRRSFDLRDRGLFEQLDPEERKFLAGLAAPEPRR